MALPLHLEMMHLARGKALMDGLAAAHFRRQASSPHAHENAQSCEAAQLGAARQALVSSVQLSSPHWQFFGHVAVEQSGKVFNDCFSVLTSRQKSLSPDAVVDVTWVLVFAKLGGMMELTLTSTGMVTSPAAIGKVRAFSVMVPAPNGSLHSTSVEASPLQDTSLTPAAETSALKVADGTS